ncbi:MAG: hypothetical protein E6I79_15010 [Chloroflexi bacterium]|nr:MAG: hypothetical protein E6I79_15010 [Chloroflexota bacterium]
MSDTAIQEQQPAPDFTLPAVGSDDVVNNGQVHLADLKGRTVVSIVRFYPLMIAHAPWHTLRL